MLETSFFLTRRQAGIIHAALKLYVEEWKDLAENNPNNESLAIINAAKLYVAECRELLKEFEAYRFKDDEGGE